MTVFVWDADDPDVVYVDGVVFTVEELDRRLGSPEPFWMEAQ